MSATQIGPNRNRRNGVAEIQIAPAVWLIPTVIAICLASCKQSDAPPAPPGARSVQELRAGCVALAQFAKDLQAQPSENKFQRFAASANSYTFIVREGRDSYTFYFGLKPFHGRPVVDEGTAYKVDKANMNVVRVAPN